MSIEEPIVEGYTLIENVPMTRCYTPEWYLFNSTPDEIKRRAEDLDRGAFPILKVAKDTDGMFAIIDGNLNFQAMKTIDMHMVRVQIIECDDPRDLPYLSIMLNKRKRLTHARIMMMIPVMKEWWQRRNPENGEEKFRQFVGRTLTDMGTPYSERNVQKLLYIIANAPQLLDKMDNTDRIVDKFYTKAQIHAGELSPDMEEPSDSVDTDEDDLDDAQTCDGPGDKLTGEYVDLTLPNGKTERIDTGKLCNKCVVKRLVFESKIVPLHKEEVPS